MDAQIARLTKVLVVDDQAGYHRLIRAVLGEEYDVESASSGKKALSIIPDFRPDIILLDVAMPDLNGIEVCRKLRADPQARFTKVIFVSGAISLQERLAGYEAGGNDYIMKPFDNEELKSKVRVMSKLKAIEQVDQIKDDFITLISHETRTPIGIIKNAFEIMANDKALERAKIENILRLVEQSVERLSELTEKTILVCKLKSLNSLSLSKTSVKSLNETLREKFPKDSKGREVVDNSDMEEANLSINRDLMGRALQYIIENAVKFSPLSDKILITGEKKDESYVIKVIDSGPGMSRERLSEVFNNFAVGNIMNHSKGLGLSLGLVSQIVELHKGKFSVESMLNEGTVCTIILPWEKGTGIL